jgi:hypothetical protein
MLLRDGRIASIQPGNALSALVREHRARESRSALFVLGRWQGHPHATAITGRYQHRIALTTQPPDADIILKTHLALVRGITRKHAQLR